MVFCLFLVFFCLFLCCCTAATPLCLIRSLSIFKTVCCKPGESWRGKIPSKFYYVTNANWHKKGKFFSHFNLSTFIFQLLLLLQRWSYTSLSTSWVSTLLSAASRAHCCSVAPASSRYHLMGSFISIRVL